MRDMSAPFLFCREIARPLQERQLPAGLLRASRRSGILLRARSRGRVRRRLAVDRDGVNDLERLCVTQPQPRLDHAVPFVDLQRERRVARARLLRPASVAPSPKRTQRARAPPDSTVKRRWRPSPIGRGSRRRAASIIRQTGGFARPNGASLPSSSASSSPSSPHSTTASTRSTDSRVARRRARRARARRTPRANASRLRAVELDPGGRAVPAEARQVLGAALQAAQQVEAVDAASGAAAALAVEARPSRPGVVALLDEPRGDDPDHAGMPASPAST